LRWLEQFEVRGRLADPARFDYEATLWHAASVLPNLLPPPRRRELSAERHYGNRATPSELIALVRHPGSWRVCRKCQGHQVAPAGGPCPECRGDGFEVLDYSLRYKAEREEAASVWSKAPSTPSERA
jgi:hypothetical protein